MADRKTKIASNWLRHIRLLLWNHRTVFYESWEDARSQRPLLSLCFFRADRKIKIAAPASDRLSNFRLFLWKTKRIWVIWNVYRTYNTDTVRSSIFFDVRLLTRYEIDGQNCRGGYNSPFGRKIVPKQVISSILGFVQSKHASLFELIGSIYVAQTSISLIVNWQQEILNFYMN